MKIIKSGDSIKNIISLAKTNYESNDDSCYSCPDTGCVCEDENSY